MMLYVGNAPVKITGWEVIGVGPLGNYSFGWTVASDSSGSVVETIYKYATEGNLTYVVRCIPGFCAAETVATDGAMYVFLRGVNATRVEKGRCTHLGYTGVLYEEKRYMGPELLSKLLGEVNGAATYTAEICEVAGVQLKGEWRHRDGHNGAGPDPDHKGRGQWRGCEREALRP